MMAATPAHWDVEEYLSYLLARASHVVASEFHRDVKAAGLRVIEWRILATLADGSELSVGELADHVLAQQPTLTKCLDRMTQDGVVTRRAAEGDKRRSLVRITQAGRRLVEDLLVRSKAHEQDTFAMLDPLEAQVLKGALRKLIARAH